MKDGKFQAGDLLEALDFAEVGLKRRLREGFKDEEWKGLFIDYEEPRVARLWCHQGQFRLYLHRIFACDKFAPLYHPHPWPSAIKVLLGRYEMVVGVGDPDGPPPVEGTRIVLAPGSCYEMLKPTEWHSIKPVGNSVLSLMITAEPFPNQKPKVIPPQRELTAQERKDTFALFRSVYI